MDPQILAFAGVSLLLTLTPGADTAVTLKNAVTWGRVGGMVSIVGTCMGLLVHAALSALGLSVILARSATAFTVVRWVGAAYLVWLGCRALWSAWRGEGGLRVPSGPTVQGLPRRSLLRPFSEGLLTNLLNPKVVLFYLAFLPQFISPGDPVLAKSLLLASIHVGWGLLWLSSLVLVLDRGRSFVQRPAVQRGLQGATGVVLVAFGARLALEKM